MNINKNNKHETSTVCVHYLRLFIYTWKPRLFRKCWGVGVIEWWRLIGWLDDWFLSFWSFWRWILTHEFQPLWRGRFIVLWLFWLVAWWFRLHIQCSSGPLSGVIPGRHMFQQTSGCPSGRTIYLRVPEHICISAKKMNNRLPRKNSLGMGNMSKQLGSLLVVRNPNISQHAHTIRFVQLL